MDYQKHYNLLIERAKNRVLDCYTESHHIIPSCMGGSDDKDNKVDLTPEEHYVAHQLLVKIYPKHDGLIHAAQMMVASSKNHKGFRKNKLYGWLKRKYHVICKQRIGEKNGSFGSFWITNGVEAKKIKGEIPEGWIKGRNDQSKYYKECPICKKQIKYESTFCRKHSDKSHLNVICRVKNTYFINDGFKDKRIKIGEPIPNGYVKGRINGLSKKNRGPYKH